MRRRAFLGLTALAALAAGASSSAGIRLADRQTGLDVSWPEGISRVTDAATLPREVRRHASVCAAGRRHSSGGQPLLDRGWIIDTTGLTAVGPVDGDVLRVEAGATWSDVGGWLRRHAPSWCIRQKQTIDGVTIGGSVAANAHGNGIGMPPLGADVAWIEWVDASGATQRAAAGDTELRAAVGGFGLTGVITALGLRLQRRVPLRAFADAVCVEEIEEAFARRAADGARYGSAMLACDPRSGDYLRRGFLVCHVPDPEGQVERARPFSARRWVDGMRLLHQSPGRAWTAMCAAWTAEAGRTWAFDDVLMGDYVDGYHALLGRGTDVIVEILVPPPALPTMLGRLRRVASPRPLLCEVRSLGVDEVALMRYVPRPMLAVALTVHLEPHALEAARASLRGVLQAALDLGGAFHPAFSWCASTPQLAQALDGLAGWQAIRDRLDPHGRFQSDWGRRHLRG